MKRGFWLITGAIGGFVVARKLANDPKAQAVVDDVARRAKEFGDAVAEGFKEREAEVKAAPKKAAPARKPTARKPAAKKPATKKA